MGILISSEDMDLIKLCLYFRLSYLQGPLFYPIRKNLSDDTYFGLINDISSLLDRLDTVSS